jgi:hypothetical protein
MKLLDKVTWIYQLQVCADDGNLFGENISITKKTTDASKDVGIQANKDKTKYMFMSRHHNAG